MLKFFSKKIISKKIFDFLRDLRVFRRKTRTYIIFFRSAAIYMGAEVA